VSLLARRSLGEVGWPVRLLLSRFFTLLIVSVIAACSSSPQRATEEVTVWRPLGNWSGKGLLQTDAFISDTGLLRITWDARAVPNVEDGTLRISVHSAVSGRQLVAAVDHRGAGRDVTYVSEDPRSFFLVIEAAGVDWSVDVAEGVGASRKK